MVVRVLTFGIARDICGSQVLHVTVDENATVDKLKSVLVQLYPALEKLTSFTIAVNGEYAQALTAMFPGDELAIIPPVSGG